MANISNPHNNNIIYVIITFIMIFALKSVTNKYIFDSIIVTVSFTHYFLALKYTRWNNLNTSTHIKLFGLIIALTFLAGYFTKIVYFFGIHWILSEVFMFKRKKLNALLTLMALSISYSVLIFDIKILTIIGLICYLLFSLVSKESIQQIKYDLFLFLYLIIGVYAFEHFVLTDIIFLHVSSYFVFYCLKWEGKRRTHFLKENVFYSLFFLLLFNFYSPFFVGIENLYLSLEYVGYFHIICSFFLSDHNPEIIKKYLQVPFMREHKC